MSIRKETILLNVYDFDNTLYDGESGVHMFFYYLKKKPSFIRFAPTVAIGMVQYKMHLIKLEDVLRKYAGIVEYFIGEVVDFNRDSKIFWDKREDRLHGFYKLLQRPDDLVVSASPEQSLEEACGRLGIKRWIGTVVNEETKTLDFINFRENKVKAFLERCPGERIQHFYTDSMNDKPLMDLAEHVFLVKKGRVVKQLK
ncbi:MAG: haloacid dehalogenase-like hydrolase [Oscillospiraceae bacterium]|nr:haloacid dehalogenase-like hydrolase [Oscillospiraceae bacterium]